MVYGANNPKYLKLPTRVCLTSALTVLSPITSTGKVIRKSNRNVIALQRLGGVGSGPLLTNPTMVDVMTSRRVASANPKYLKLPTRVCLTSALTVLSPITSTGKVIRKSNRNVIALQRLGGVGSGPLLTNPTMVDVMTSRRVASNRFSKTPFSDTRVSPVLPSISNRDHKSCCIQAGIYVTGLVQGKRATHLCYTP